MSLVWFCTSNFLSLQGTFINHYLRRYNDISSLYLLIQSSTLKKCIEHCLTALATLLHVNHYLVNYKLCYKQPSLAVNEQLNRPKLCAFSPRLKTNKSD